MRAATYSVDHDRNEDGAGDRLAVLGVPGGTDELLVPASV